MKVQLKNQIKDQGKISLPFYQKISFVLLILIGGVAGATSVSAPPPAPSAELDTATETVKPKKEDSERTWEEIFIDDDIAITNWVDGAADGLDLFLMGQRLTTMKNNTHLRLQNATYANDGQGIKNANTLAVDLRLPNVEEYWLLKFSTYDENAESRGIQNGYLRQQPQVRNYGASVGFFKKIGEVRVAFQPRIDLKNPLGISHSLSFESIADYTTYQINPKLEFFAEPDKGAGIFNSLNINFILTKVYSLTFINYGEYDEKPKLFSVTNGFSIGQVVSKRSSLAYSLLFNSVSQPSYQLAGYSFAVAWSHLIYRKIFDYQLIPHLDYIAANSYQGTLGITINFNFNF